MLSAEPLAQSGKQYLETQNSPNQNLLPLSARVNSKNHLEIGGCDVTTLVAQYGTPLYIVDEMTLRTACRQYRDSFKSYYSGESQVIYASKAWSCLAVCGVIASEGLGFDVVSSGELYTTLTALEQMGIAEQSLNKIYFHGNNKSESELKYALSIGCKIIVDNWLELETLVKLGSDLGVSSIPILLRLTPGIECHTHEYIRTGHLDSKFGFDPNQMDAVLTYVSQQPILNCLGLHAHIGSQIFERQPHQDLGGVLIEWMQKAIHKYNLSITEINVGGGLGIRYTESDDPPSIEEWVKTVSLSVMNACQINNLPLPKLIAEPGRSLIATACVTAYTVGSRKEIPNIRTYIAVDGGMSDNPRPITYQSVYRTVIANKMSTFCQETVTIAGKHCESGDILIKDAQIPLARPGDILVVMATGAYNYSMASNYNRLPRPAAVIVSEGEANLILHRETNEDLLRQDRLPERLKQEFRG
ncbi:diaminopimelate decarboxylase [Aphanothece hegewaldii CCALA 016]|uniref:Diaminopimelate decarboxylase n=1 Tax=Aphanothece hegewaldii CCALA 016 TaxID=2107694 RepID=A0A2T1M0L6_9CHRO|nr:diaminopimelate decarboxylase [Aphanothece hegewaldii]PSF38145.1 diaminopimelate decarboxylase [Aphanothece hegewaldii CCALA 016]